MIYKNVVPDGFILLISGVPGVGKTTISYELLKRIPIFRIIEETDILRDALKGYNTLLRETFGGQISYMLDRIHISNHGELLTYSEAKEQCAIMKKSLEGIIARQKRKRISTIINGVHIIPEGLQEFAGYSELLFLNLYVTEPDIIYNRIADRNPSSDMLNHIPLLFSCNDELRIRSEKLGQKSGFPLLNLDTSRMDIDTTINKIMKEIPNYI